MLPNYVDKGMTWIQLYLLPQAEWDKKGSGSKKCFWWSFQKKITEKPRKKNSELELPLTTSFCIFFEHKLSSECGLSGQHLPTKFMDGAKFYF